MKNQLSFLDAESTALDLATKEFNQGSGGLGFVFIMDRRNGNECTEEEKKVARYISQTSVKQLKDKKLTQMIQEGVVPDCVMARRFMATGSGFRENGSMF
jgi:hypothetical protein